MFSQACVKNSVHKWGGGHMREKGDMRGEEGVCVANGA